MNSWGKSSRISRPGGCHRGVYTVYLVSEGQDDEIWNLRNFKDLNILKVRTREIRRVWFDNAGYSYSVGALYFIALDTWPNERLFDDFLRVI